MILKKREQPNINIKAAEELAKKLNLNIQIVELMFFRGIDTEEKINDFLHPDINKVYDPFLFNDMDKVVAKINKAVKNNRHILIYGDYDVDGMSATSILYKYLKSVKTKVSYFLPNRYVDGYGLTIGTLDKIKEKFNPDLIITVDCGVTAVEEVVYSKRQGMDIIITDHHEAPEVLPNCLIINPKLKGQNYPFKELCGAGVALKTVQALGGMTAASKYLDICAVATIADIVELKDENRIIVQLGLNKLKTNANEGIKTLLKQLRLTTNVTSTDIAFKVAPKINAAGRMGQAQVGLKLLLEKDKKELGKIVTKLLDLNSRRQELCQMIYEEATEKLNKINITKEKIIVLADAGWDAGLLGITAARIADEFNRPTIMFSHVDGKYKGSARSINGINIHEAISCVTADIEAFGGHTMAAGLTVDESQFDAFKSQIKECMHNKFDASYFYPQKFYDIDLRVEEVTVKFIKELNLLTPFGHKNPLPVFNLAFNSRKVLPMKNYPEHLTINFNKIFSLLNFNGAKNIANYQFYNNKNALIELQLNSFRGRENVRGIVKNLSFSNMDTKMVDEFVTGVYLKQLMYEKLDSQLQVETYDKDKFEEFVTNKIKQAELGNLVVFSKISTYKKHLNLIKQLNLQTHLFKVGNKLGINAVVVSLNSFSNLNSFNNIFFADEVLDENFIKHLKNNTTAQIYTMKSAIKPEFKIDLSRDIFGAYFNIFKHANKQKINANCIFSYYGVLKEINRHIENFNFSQFIACVEVFKELNLIIENDEITNYYLKIDKNVTSSLDNSSIYNKLKQL
jgi:single-stranded-DNA-specific exonuclease